MKDRLLGILFGLGGLLGILFIFLMVWGGIIAGGCWAGKILLKFLGVM